MRSRVVGGIAMALGLLIMFTLFISEQPIALKPMLGALIFISLGGYYLVTGRKAATLREFVVDGKLSHDNSKVKTPNPIVKRDAP